LQFRKVNLTLASTLPPLQTAVVKVSTRVAAERFRTVKARVAYKD
jgi:hypothetical protein